VYRPNPLPIEPKNRASIPILIWLNFTIFQALKKAAVVAA
jgi:hypothetical protein